MTKNSENTKPSNSTKPVLANRLFKFRAWDNDSKSFLKGDFSIGIISGEFRGKYGEVFKNVIVNQFSGLKDKNGKEIYEGDIVSIEYGKGIVEYSEKQSMFIINWIDDNEAYNESLAYNTRNYIYGKTRKDIEVIGNIYESSDLLQGFL